MIVQNDRATCFFITFVVRFVRRWARVIITCEVSVNSFRRLVLVECITHLIKLLWYQDDYSVVFMLGIECVHR